MKVNFSIIKIKEEKPRPTQRIRSAENKTLDINAINKTVKENEFNQLTKTIRLHNESGKLFPNFVILLDLN